MTSRPCLRPHRRTLTRRAGEPHSPVRPMFADPGGLYLHRMRHRIERILRNPRVQGAGDVLLTLALAATSVAGVLVGQDSSGRVEPLALVFALLSTVPVAFRTRRPLLAARLSLLLTLRVSMRQLRTRPRSSPSSP